MVQNSNQFRQTPTRGSKAFNGLANNVITAIVDPDLVGSISAGDPVKLVASNTGAMPQVTALEADTDITHGVALYNPIRTPMVAHQRVEVAMLGTAVVLEAGAAVSAGAELEAVSASGKFITAAGTNPKCAFALTSASGDESLFTAIIMTPFVQQPEAV